MATNFPTPLQLAGRSGGLNVRRSNLLTNIQTNVSELLNDASPENLELAENLITSSVEIIPPAAQPAAQALLQSIRTDRAKTPAERKQNRILASAGGAPQQLVPGTSRTVNLEAVPGVSPGSLESVRLPSGTLQPGERESGRIVTSSGDFAKALVETAPVLSNKVAQVAGFSAANILELRRTGLDLGTINAMNQALTTKSVTATLPDKVETAIIEGGDLPAGIARALASQDVTLRKAALGKLQDAQQLVAQRAAQEAETEAASDAEAKLNTPFGFIEGIRNDIFIEKKLALETGEIKVFSLATPARTVFAKGIRLKQKDMEAIRNFGSALTLVDEIEDVGLRLFTSSDPNVVAWRGGEILTKKILDQNPDIALWTSQGGLMFGLAKALGNDSRISDADREFAAETAGIKNFQSREGLVARMARLRRIMGSGKRRIFGQGPLRPPGFVKVVPNSPGATEL